MKDLFYLCMIDIETSALCQDNVTCRFQDTVKAFKYGIISQRDLIQLQWVEVGVHRWRLGTSVGARM